MLGDVPVQRAMLAMLCVIVACHQRDSFAPTPDVPVNVTGRIFDIVRIDGRSLPAEIDRFTFRPPCSPDTVGRGQWRFFEQGTFDLWWWRDPSSADSASVRMTSVFRQDGAMLTFQNWSLEGRLFHDTLMIDVTLPLTCRPQRWLAVLRAG